MGKKYKLVTVILIIVVIIMVFYSYKDQNLGKVSANKKDTIRKFGATYMNMNNPYFTALDNSIEQALAVNGDILITRDPAQNQEKQNEQIKEMIDKGVVAIFINPVDWKAIKPALVQCHEAGVAVFNIDTHVYDMDYIQTCILSDNYSAGVQIANDVIKKKSSAKIAIINDSSVNSSSLRVEGFLDTIKGKETYEVVYYKNGTVELEGAMEFTKEMIDGGIVADVILGGNDPTALGALAALQLREVDLEDILIYGVDGSPDVKRMIEKGYIEGTSAQFPIKMGKKAVELAYKYLDGVRVQDRVIIPVELITKGNLSEYDRDSWQ